MAFKEKYENAGRVWENPTATQDEIDTANSELTAAMAALEGHPFIAPAPQITANDKVLENNDAVETDDDAKVTLNPQFADGAMMKSYTFTYSDLENATAVKNEDGSITFTRTAENGAATVTLTTVDDYDRTDTVELRIKLVEKLVPCTDLVLMANGEQLGDSYTYSCGGSYSNIDLTIGYVPVPSNANMIESVTYSGSTSFVKIDSSTGKVTMGTLALLSSYKATITCTVTNTDGSTVKKSVSLTVKRN